MQPALPPDDRLDTGSVESGAGGAGRESGWWDTESVTACSDDARTCDEVEESTPSAAGDAGDAVTLPQSSPPAHTATASPPVQRISAWATMPTDHLPAGADEATCTSQHAMRGKSAPSTRTAATRTASADDDAQRTSAMRPRGGSGTGVHSTRATVSAAADANAPPAPGGHADGSTTTCNRSGLHAAASAGVDVDTQKRQPGDPLDDVAGRDGATCACPTDDGPRRACESTESSSNADGDSGGATARQRGPTTQQASAKRGVSTP
jgi:hypothetical protein